MKYFSYALRFSLLFFVLSHPGNSAAIPTKVGKTLLLISMDGFRWDYMDKAPTPQLHALAKRGVRAKGLQPVFPTLTFPNHYTIITGLYPEHHGIIGNEMYDPGSKHHFQIKNADEVNQPEWWHGEPLWVTAQRQGIRAGTMFWVGSNAEIDGMRPTYWEKFDAKVTREDRMKKIFEWLDLPVDSRPRLLMIYFQETDTAGHEFGPDSEQEHQAITQLDTALGVLMEGIRKRGMESSTDIIVVSDHGMATVEQSHVMRLEDWISIDDADAYEGGALMGVWPKPGKEESVLKKLRTGNGHFHVYEKKDIPARFHFKENRRIAPLLLVADEGWYLSRAGKIPSSKRETFGAHGYDDELSSMQGTFVAAGPSFKRGIEIGTVKNIDLYALMCQILAIAPSPNDGSLARVENMLKTVASP